MYYLFLESVDLMNSQTSFFNENVTGQTVRVITIEDVLQQTVGFVLNPSEILERSVLIQH